jgi:putative nucleotidyltransferase with HDIG domain
MVNKVANYLAKKLKENGIRIDLNVVDCASLLHDIGKSITILDKLEDKHHILAEEILTKEGYPELGLVCRRHSLRELKNVSTWEEKVVKYADLRVKHDKLVSVKERMEDLGERYAFIKEEKVPLSKVLELEKEIYDKLGESPEDMEKVIR